MQQPSGLRRGVLSGLAAVLMLIIAAFPSRLSLAIRGWGLISTRVEKALVGTLLDLSAVIVLITPLIAIFALVLPLIFKRLRGPRWQRIGALVCGLPFGFSIWTLTVTAQEVKSERGSFPTTFDLLEGGTNASFLEGTVGYLRYERIWEPGVVGILLAAALVFLVWRRRREATEWRPWATGLSVGLAAGTAFVLLTSAGLAAAANRFTSAALGDPLTGIVESSIDLLNHKGPATPRELVLATELPAGSADVGASRLGWPALNAGKRVRPLDWSKEPMTKDPRGRKLLDSLGRVSRALFTGTEARVAVWQLSLEGFRADDIHALNPLAPKQIAPFTSSLYEDGKPGVLVSRKMFQAGVRTAHCLGAMTCGVGTLPYNLSFIRDLQPFPVRCASDVLEDAGFAHSFFYGSDVKFDEMGHFFAAHGYERIVSQAELPTDLPKGTWDGITDFAVFDTAVREVNEKFPNGPQFAFLMSLSNHSPFTTPQDMPPEVITRVDEGLAAAVNRADADDRLRLLTFSYTDAAVQRVFEKLEQTSMLDSSIVVLMADHSTGHAYVWGKEDPESDEAKTQIPFAIVIPEAFQKRAQDPAELSAALAEAQALLDEAPLSQNDVPSLILALLSNYGGVKDLSEASRWHTLGGQVTSPYFEAGGEKESYILGINGVSELYALDRKGVRVGGYEDSVFLKTRADRYRVTPRLIPVTATLIETMRQVDQK
ncbi:MAG: sulfatase-like hydrolase/transferase [Archangium sp.]|nr:sulfatase-like hydrolase/transferase [Archangium sp.]